jgi:hypothetical protein
LCPPSGRPHLGNASWFSYRRGRALIAELVGVEKEGGRL